MLTNLVMLRNIQFIQRAKLIGSNSLVNYGRTMCNKSLDPNLGKKEEEEELPRGTYPPTALDKRLYVWIGKYKSIDEIPPLVTISSIENVRNRARIKIANYMIVGTLIGCFYFALSGKRAAQRGESVVQMNLDWHSSMKEKKDS